MGTSCLSDVTVVIPVRNGERYIGKCLESVLKAGGGEARIMVVDDHSVDETRAIVKRYEGAGVVLLDNPGEGPSSARNLAISRAETRFIAFTDADCLADEGWLWNLLNGMEPEGAAGAGGRQEPYPRAGRFEGWVHEVLALSGFAGGYMKWGRRARRTGHNPACNSIYRVSVLRETGGFEDGLFPGEDVDLDYRLRMRGWKVLYIPDAVVYHARPTTLAGFLRMLYRYGRDSGGYLFRKYGFFRKIYLVPPLFILLLLLFFSLLLTFQSPALYLITGILLLLYLIILLRTGHPIDALFTTLLTAAGFLAWNAGFFGHYLFAKKRVSA